MKTTNITSPESNGKDHYAVGLTIHLYGGGRAGATMPFFAAKNIIGHIEGFLAIPASERDAMYLVVGDEEMRAPYRTKIHASQIIGYEVHKKKENAYQAKHEALVDMLLKQVGAGEEWRDE